MLETFDYANDTIQNKLRHYLVKEVPVCAYTHVTFKIQCYVFYKTYDTMNILF
jgi:hypothetical protein